MKNIKNFVIPTIFSLVLLFVFGIQIQAEQSGDSPESGSDSYLKQGYDWLVAKGVNYGGTDSADWSEDWGTYWNRIMEAAAWEPGGTAVTGEVPSGLTFYANGNDRAQQIGTLFENQINVRYDDWLDNGGTTGEYTGEESTWTQTATGGVARSVTDNGVTVTLSSNTVYQDERTKLYWSDYTTSSLDNEFSWVLGDDAENPTGNSCNFNSDGVANEYCDNQDPLDILFEDNDVSAAEFCLNLELDADNADGDNDGATGRETDWYLPTVKELLQAYIDGAFNNFSIVTYEFWSSTESATNAEYAYIVGMRSGYAWADYKDYDLGVRCVRRD